MRLMVEHPQLFHIMISCRSAVAICADAHFFCFFFPRSGKEDDLSYTLVFLKYLLKFGVLDMFFGVNTLPPHKVSKEA